MGRVRKDLTEIYLDADIASFRISETLARFSARRVSFGAGLIDLKKGVDFNVDIYRRT